MAKGASCALSGGEFEGPVDELDGGGDVGDHLSIDLDTLMHILEESSDPSQDGLPDDLNENLEVGSHLRAADLDNSASHIEFQVEQPNHRWIESADPLGLYPSCNQGAVHATVGTSGFSFEGGVNSDVDVDDVQLEASPQVSSPVQAYLPSTKKCCSQVQRDHAGEEVGVSQSLLASCSTSSFAGADFDRVGDLDCNVLPGGSGAKSRNLADSVVSNDASCGPWKDNLDREFRYRGALFDNGKVVSYSENAIRKSMEVMFVDADASSHMSISNKSTFCHNSGVTDEFDVNYPVMPFGTNREDTYFADFPYYYASGVSESSLLPSDVVAMANETYEISRFPNQSDFSVSQTSSIDHSALKEMNSNYVPFSRDEMGEFHTRGDCSVSQTSLADYSYEKTINYACEGSNYTSPMDGSISCNAGDRFVDKASIIPFSFTWPGVDGKREDCIDNGNNDELAAHRSMTCCLPKPVSEVDGKYSCSEKDSIYAEEDLNQSSSGISSPIQNLRYAVYAMGETVPMNFASEKAGADGISGIYSSEDYLNLNDSELCMAYVQPSGLSNRQLSLGKDEDKCNVLHPEGVSSRISRVSPESIQSNLSGGKSCLDNDSDIRILEDISQSVSWSQFPTPGKHIQPLQRARHSDSVHSVGVGGTRLKTTDERIIFQAALQDLGQPKSEASPPDGVLAVPLLRHQRIALSWMVQKETSSFYCSGGILADDQGLGKTVSTIALILTERPSLRVDPKVVKNKELETLDLDGDDEVIEIDGRTGICKTEEKTKDFDGIQLMSNQNSAKRSNSFTQSKESPVVGRPAAGTLVVCPTSVLRQWAEELQKKVTSEANLTVFVYHGANRTKDPGELAKYDVVLTTYSIVSMEVPKQTFDDEDDEEKGKLESGDVSLLGLAFGKKRKYPPSSSKKAPKSKKVMDSAAFNSMARPLAKVRWFRVVLDEAQSIKNHRTQVARACWGLRAKRRWCLSGTPVQNAIDDLYSYFRFLRYDPYSAYKSFCSTIKGPIQRNPKIGYTKLQAVLKTIMLRRTKGTLLDGEPIITLPPKVVELKKVEFTVAERDFYTRLEADSRAQFKEYADAGTVKQNYVNILLMLLRLRQACDHPLLVRGVDTSSLGKSSVEMAKNLPREKQICLLNCLEASLAICGICSDPPEDAVVSVCGHVFCNQCICEHLCGDDKQCPSSNCKVRLSASSVFSKATLASSLSDQPIQECSGHELKSISSYSEESSFDSSKIRAALEVLQSLNKPQDCTSTHSSLESSFQGNATCVESSVVSGSSINDNIDKGNTSRKVVSEKAIVFSQWTRMLDLLEARLKSCSIQYRRLDGTMSVAARDKAVKDFNTLPEISVMIMSLKAASLGLNMVAACHVLLLDLWWNPTTEDQAIDRAHRIGQTRPVTVLRLTVKNTVEDRILALQQKKREMVSSAFGEDENGGRQTRLTVDDLNYLFMV